MNEMWMKWRRTFFGVDASADHVGLVDGGGSLGFGAEARDQDPANSDAGDDAQRQAEDERSPPGNAVEIEQTGSVQDDGEDINGQRQDVEDRKEAQSGFERVDPAQDEAAQEQVEGAADQSWEDGRDEPRSDDPGQRHPLDAFRAARHQREADHGAHDAVRPRNRKFQESGHQHPHGTSAQRCQIAHHQFRIGILIDGRIDDPFAYRIRYFVTYQDFFYSFNSHF